MKDDNCSTNAPPATNPYDDQVSTGYEKLHSYRYHQSKGSEASEAIHHNGPYRFLLTMSASPSVQRRDFQHGLFEYLTRLGEWLSVEHNYFSDIFRIGGVAVYDWPGKEGVEFKIYVGFRDNPLLSRDDQEATDEFLNFLTSNMDSFDEDDPSVRPNILGLVAHVDDVTCGSLTSILQAAVGRETSANHF